MELERVMGNRRSIRYYLPHRPVERSKIQKMLEAARRASCVGNVNSAKAIVIWKDQASPELIKAITPPLGYQQMQTAPCFILWYHDTAAYEINKWIGNLIDLVEQRRIGDDVEQTKQVIEKNLRAAFSATWQQSAVSPLAFMDLGQAVAQATLMAWDKGLSTCCMSSPRLEQLGGLLNLPETAVPVCLMSVGYPAESWEAGGQTRKAPFSDLFSEMKYGSRFKEDAQVAEELKQSGLFQEEAPLSWRDDELKYLRHALGLEAQVVAPQFQAPAQAGGQEAPGEET